MKILISILILLFLNSCSLINAIEPHEVEIKPEQVESFRDLLKQGWIIQVYNNKVFLIKMINGRVYTLDIFNLLEEN